MWLTAAHIACPKSASCRRAQYTAIASVSSATQPSPSAWILAKSLPPERERATARRIILLNSPMCSAFANICSIAFMLSSTACDSVILSSCAMSVIMCTSAAAGIYPSSCPWVTAAASAPARSISAMPRSAGSRYSPIGATRITPPQPLLLFCARVPFRSFSAHRQVLPGARRLKISGIFISQL